METSEAKYNQACFCMDWW